MVDDLLAGREPQPASDFLEAYSEALFDERASPRLIADLVTLPDEKSLGQHFEIIPIEEIHTAREIVRLCLADRNRDRLLDLYHRCRVEDPLDMSSGAVGTRRLKSVCLDYLVALGEDDCDELAFRQVRDDGNTSNQVYALMSLANSDSACRDEALALFRDRWRNEQLVYDKWFLAQALAARTDTAERLAAVTATEEFSLQMLSRVFATTEAFFCLNRYGFNERGGSGYRLMAELARFRCRPPGKDKGLPERDLQRIRGQRRPGGTGAQDPGGSGPMNPGNRHRRTISDDRGRT